MNKTFFKKRLNAVSHADYNIYDVLYSSMQKQIKNMVIPSSQNSSNIPLVLGIQKHFYFIIFIAGIILYFIPLFGGTTNKIIQHVGVVSGDFLEGTTLIILTIAALEKYIYNNERFHEVHVSVVQI